MVTKKISKFPPPPKLKLTLSVYNRVFAFSTLTWHASVNLGLWHLEIGLILSVVFYMIWASPAWTFRIPAGSFNDLLSGFQNPSSEFHNLVLEFHNPPGRVSQYDFPVSQCKFHNTTCKFQNTTSKCHNPSFRIHSPHFAIRSPSFTIRRWPVHQGFLQGFLWISWWFIAFFFRFHLVHVQSFCKVSFRFLSMFLARLFHGVLMRFSYNFFARFFWFSCTVSFKFLAGFLTVSFWHAFFRQLSPIEARNSGTTDPIFAPLRATYKNT